MKKLSKALVACAAITTLTAAMAVVASADMTATYDAEAGTVAITGFTTQDQNTMVVLQGEDTAITSESIKAIDQTADAATAFSAVKVGTLADGTYTVKVGGTAGTVDVATFEVGDPNPPVTVVVGDANDDGKVNIVDASAIASWIVGTGTVNQDNADANKDGKVNIVDASAIANWIVGTGSLGA